MTRLTDIPRDTASRWPGAPALAWVQGTGAGGFTHAELCEGMGRGAARLIHSGIRPGDRVILAIEPRPEWALAFFSILAAGAVAVPVPANIEAQVLARVVGFCAARAAISGVAGEKLDAGLGGIPRIDAGELAGSDCPVPQGYPPATRAGDDLAVLAFTSGSTGQPRAVELTHGSILADIRSLRAVRQAGPGDSFLSLLPPHHLFELTAGLLGPLACGARVVYPGTLLPNRLLGAIRAERITHLMCVPALLELLHSEMRDELAGDGRLLLAERIRSALGPALRSVIVGGAALDPAWWERSRVLGMPLEVGYGLTEASPVVSLARLADCPAGSVGAPLPGVEVRVDPSGEILVRGPNVMRGYHRDPVGTRDALRDGWLRTGDLGRLDESGFLFVTGRLKEAMVSENGETVHPDEVEPHYASPLFGEWCVIGVPGPHGNDLPTLFVVPAAAGVDPDRLRGVFEDLRARAPSHCRVARLVILDRPLPRTATGKVRRRLLVPVGVVPSPGTPDRPEAIST